MKAFLRILKILGVFFACLALISLVWYFVESLNPSSGGANSIIDYVLYLIGYGDLEIENHYSLALFSMISLFTLTLMSSVFTVNLFELRSKARLLQKIKIESHDKSYTAYAEIKTIGNDIYDVNAVLIAKIGEEVYSEEVYLPFVPRKHTQRIKLSFDIGSPLYKYMRASIEGDDTLIPLIITLTYTDIEGGQEYKSCAKYVFTQEGGDFVYTNAELYESVKNEYLLSKEFLVDMTRSDAINDEDISLTFEKSNGMQSYENIMRATVNMTSRSDYEPKSFVMACLSDFDEIDWRKYADLGYHLDFEYLVKGSMTVTLELKYGEKNIKVYRQELRSQNEFRHCSVDLNSSAVSYDELSNVREMCLTVFYEDTDPQTRRGEFVIKNVALRMLESAKKA